MGLVSVLRIAWGIVAAILGLLCCPAILGVWLFVPVPPDMTALQDGESNVLYTLLFIASAVGFAWLARWCFTGRGFKQRS